MDLLMVSNQLSQNSGKNLPQVRLSNRCLETQAQIMTVLQVMGMASGALGQFLNWKDPEHPLKMTEGQIALEKTLWSACERMQNLLDDSARWDNSFQEKVEQEYDKLTKLQTDTLTAQRAAAQEITTPHFRYRPALMRLVDGGWMAIIGDVDHLEFAVYGVGKTVQAAIEDFDEVFLRGVPKSVMAWCNRREENFETGKPTDEPYPNKEKINHDDGNLDDSGTEQSPTPKG